MQFILNNGSKIPKIGFGTYLIKDETICKSVVTEALKVGYRMIDTASVYMNEEFIGQVIENLDKLALKREEIFITTKVGPGDQGKGKCRESVLRSLRNLKTPYLDLVLIHWPGVRNLDPKDANNSVLRKQSYEDLEDLHKEGLIKSIGVSNYTISHLQELLKHCSVAPTVNQVEFHPLLYQKELLEYCNENKILFEAYSSLGSAKGWDILSTNETIVNIASKYNKSVAKILLKWALQHNVCIIPKTSRIENIKPNLDLFDFEISTEDMLQLDNLNTNTRYCWDPSFII